MLAGACPYYRLATPGRFQSWSPTLHIRAIGGKQNLAIGRRRREIGDNFPQEIGSPPIGLLAGVMK